MNALLWVLQVALALQSFAGGAYKLFMYDEIAKVPAMAALTRGGWDVVGVLEMVCAVLLIVPAATKWRPILTPLAAALLALEGFALAGVYGHYSLSLAATNPMVYAIGAGLLATFVAWGRYSLRPQA